MARGFRILPTRRPGTGSPPPRDGFARRESGFDLSRASLRGCDLTGAILEGANLQYANIEGACLEGTTANSTQFYGCRYDAETRWPVGTSHKTLQAFGPQTRLPFAHLAGIRLLDADLREADLRAANMERVQLDRSRLDEARLDGALLFNASLREVSLVGGSLPRANLRRADLTQADLRDTNLRAADLREANLDGTLFEGASTSYRTKWPPDFQQSRTNPPRRGMSSRLVFIPLVWPLMLYLLIGRMLFLGIHQINTITAFLARKARWSPLTGLEIDAYNFHNDKRFALTWPISAPLGVVAALALLAAGLVAALVGSTWTFLRRSWRTSEDVLDALWHWTKS